MCSFVLNFGTWLPPWRARPARSVAACASRAVRAPWALTGRVLSAAALGVQQPSLLGASPTIYTQQTALAAAGLTTQTPANYQLTQSAALQQQAAAAAAALQQVKHTQRPALPELRKAKGSRRKGEWKMVNIAVWTCLIHGGGLGL